ncbi:MAG: SMC-Scp complex subunit ScpB [Clostridia bacterium]|nr:SMC-Scp complex subunit ScpB [Clostridia bacterium]
METLANIIESIVFVSGNQIAVKDIADKLEVSEKQVLDAAKKLQEKYNENSGINLLVFNKKLQFCSNPKYAEDVAVVLNPIRERELSKSMLEVAAIIAYKQPVTRLDLEEIRGVDSEYAIQNLLKLGVIEVVGRKDAIGRPVLFGTTDGFLKRFQIPSLDALPDYDKLLSAIASSNKDSYLFRKDEYDETKDPEYVDNSAQLSLNVVDEQPNDTFEQTESEDFELGDISDEEIPDFLQGEKLTKIN